MGFYILTKDPVKTNVYNSMSPKYNWFYEKNKEPIFIPTNSMILGLYKATKIVKDQNINLEYSNTRDLFNDYKKKLIRHNTEVLLNGESTCYGREYISSILHTSLNSIIDKVDPVTNKYIHQPVCANNIGKLISVIGSMEDRIEIIHELLQFSRKIVTITGSSVLKLGDMFKIDPRYPEINDVLNSNMSDKEKYRVLEELIPKLVTNMIKNLDSTTFSEARDAGTKVKMQSLIEIYSPQTRVSNGTIKVYDNSIMTGMTEEALVYHTMSNRKILDEKAKMVATGGYFTRQLVRMMQDMLYRTDLLSSDEVGIVVPKFVAVGRTGLDGQLIPDNNSTELIRIKSSVNSNSILICKDEIDYNFYKFDNYARIGMNMATGLTEGIVQKALGLKHGGKVFLVSTDKLIAKTDLTVESIGNGFMIFRDNNQKLYMYPIQKDAVMCKVLDDGFVPKDSIICYSADVNYLDYKLAALKALIGVLASDITTKSVPVRQCYAINSGVIHYSKNGKSLKIDSTPYPLYEDALYIYPDGYEVQKGDRICSGILDLKTLMYREKDTGWQFFIFMKQMIELLFGNDIMKKAKSIPMSLESLELIYKLLLTNPENPKIHAVNRNNPRMLSKLAYGYGKEAVRKNINKPIEDSLLLRMIIGDHDMSTYGR